MCGSGPCKQRCRTLGTKPSVGCPSVRFAPLTLNGRSAPLKELGTTQADGPSGNSATTSDLMDAVPARSEPRGARASRVPTQEVPFEAADPVSSATGAPQ